MSDQIERLVTYWDSNYQKLDEKLNKMTRAHYAAAAKMKKDADTFTAQMEKRYGAAGLAMANVFNDSRMATIQAGAGHLRVFGSALEPLGVAGLAAAAGVTALAVATQQTVAAMQFADEIDDAAQKLNVGTTALQEFRFAMTEVGGEAADADKAIEAFNKTLGLAQSGLSPKAKKAFDALGIDQATLDSWDSFEDAIPRLSREIAALGKESERAAVVEKLGLGPMLPLLREGQEEMERLRRKAQEIGIVMGAELVAKGAEANQQFQTMAEVINVQLTSAFVELSDEVVGFVTIIADALKSLNDFIERANRLKAITGGGFDVGNIARIGTADGLVRTGWGAVSGALHGPQKADPNKAVPVGGLPTGRLTHPERGGGGRRGRDTAEQRERQQEQFDRELARVQTELLRWHERELQSIQSQTATKLAVLAAERAETLRDITQREEEYARSDGLRGLSKAQADQLRAVQESVAAEEEAQIIWEERRALAEYQLGIEEEASRQTIALLGIQRGLAITARDRHRLGLQILAEEHRQARERDKAELADDLELDAAGRQAELNRRDGVRQAEYDREQRQNSGAQEARDILAEIRDPEERLAEIAQMYEEIERLRATDLQNEEDYARAKQEIDLRYREARLENTRTMLDTLATLQSSSNKKLAAIGKAAAVAQATIDGVLAVQKALAAFPPPFNFVQAAIVGAAAAANVAQIAGMKDGGLVVGPGGPRDDRVPRMLSAGEFVVNAGATGRHRALLESINSGSNLISGLNGAAANLGGVRSGAGATIHFSPSVDARGADSAAVARIERALTEQRRAFAEDVGKVMDRRERFSLGGRR
jgi:hypothetical protein